jgi:Pentapeptide repeats (8 copies)
VLFVPAADWLAHHDVGPVTGSVHETAVDNARGRLLTLGAGLFAAGALVFTARNFTVSRRTLELTEQGQVTDRYTKAIEQVGSDKLDVRIGGIYALERVARDSARDHPTVMEVLTAFIREHSREQWPPSDHPASEEHERSTRPDVRAALTVVGRRDRGRDIRSIDLGRADLWGANLHGVDLTAAHLVTTILAGANLTGADLAYADLDGADLGRAILGPRAPDPCATARRGLDPRAPGRRGLDRCDPEQRDPGRRGPGPRDPHRRGPGHRDPASREPGQRGPHERRMARGHAGSGGLDTGLRLWPARAAPSARLNLRRNKAGLREELHALPRCGVFAARGRQEHHR